MIKMCRERKREEGWEMGVFRMFKIFLALNSQLIFN